MRPSGSRDAAPGHQAWNECEGSHFRVVRVIGHTSSAQTQRFFLGGPTLSPMQIIGNILRHSG